MNRPAFTRATLLAILIAGASHCGAQWALAATITPQSHLYPALNANWSNPAIWNGNMVPGPADDVVIAFQTYPSQVTYSRPAGATPAVPPAFDVKSINGFRLTLVLADNLTVQNLYLREGVIKDNGKKLVVLGTLSNSSSAQDTSPGNGLSRTPGGGSLELQNVDLKWSSDLRFFPGDKIHGTFTFNYYGTILPAMSVTQDPLYPGGLGSGLTFENSGEAIKIVEPSPSPQYYLGTVGKRAITLNWDSALTWDSSLGASQVDWTLRWKGDHVETLRNLYRDGYMVVGTRPSNQVFDPMKNIFLHQGYTYVGFAGVLPPPDTCAQTQLRSGDKIGLQAAPASGSRGFITSVSDGFWIANFDAAKSVFEVVAPLDSQVGPAMGTCMPPVSLKLVNTDRYVVLGEPASAPYTSSNGLALRPDDGTPQFKTRATLRPRPGASDSSLLSILAVNPGRHEWLWNTRDVLLTGIPGAPEHTPAVTWRVVKQN